MRHHSDKRNFFGSSCDTNHPNRFNDGQRSTKWAKLHAQLPGPVCDGTNENGSGVSGATPRIFLFPCAPPFVNQAAESSKRSRKAGISMGKTISAGY